MNDKDSLIPTNANELDTELTDITEKLITEKSVSGTQDLIDLFNWTLSKKNALRLTKLAGLYDIVLDQIGERLNRRSGEFSNSDLLNYLQTIETSMEKSQKNLSGAQAPTINVQNNTQVNVNVVDTFDDDAKARIQAAIQALMSSDFSNSVDMPVDADFEIKETNTTITNDGEDKNQ